MESVLKIWLDASIQAHDFIDSEYWISNVPNMRDVYLPLSRTIVWDSHGAVLGFASITQNTLAALFVSPGCQGRGIGSRLIRKAKEMHNVLRLNVYKENKKSVAFYEKHGFKRVDEQIDKPTGHPEIAMIWNA